MAVPQRKISKARKRIRRSHLAIRVPNPVKCTRCETPIEPHTICPECGYYGDKPVIAVEEGF